MRLEKQMFTLYAVTDRSWLDGSTLYDDVKRALEGGVTMVQLREKEMPEEELTKEALQIQELCQSFHVPFIINDDVMLAKQIDADGVHVGQSDMALARAREILGKDKIIGVTAKTVEQAKQAYAGGADYLGSGAVFGTQTKKDAKPMTLELFHEICLSVPIPVVAIGGINVDNVEKLAGSGMAGIAVVSGLFAASDITETAGALRYLSEQAMMRAFS